jgi:hypothetical protein
MQKFRCLVERVAPEVLAFRYSEGESSGLALESVADILARLCRSDQAYHRHIYAIAARDLPALEQSELDGDLVERPAGEPSPAALFQTWQEARGNLLQLLASLRLADWERCGSYDGKPVSIRTLFDRLSARDRACFETIERLFSKLHG